MYQTTMTPKPDRKDHIWRFLPNRRLHKCILCGAVVAVPPAYPTPAEWLAEEYEVLTPEDRDLAARQAKHRGK